MVFYCNRECQANHWRAEHKATCKRYPLFTAETAKRLYANTGLYLASAESWAAIALVPLFLRQILDQHGDKLTQFGDIINPKLAAFDLTIAEAVQPQLGLLHTGANMTHRTIYGLVQPPDLVALCTTARNRHFTDIVIPAAGDGWLHLLLTGIGGWPAEHVHMHDIKPRPHVHQNDSTDPATYSSLPGATTLAILSWPDMPQTPVISQAIIEALDTAHVSAIVLLHDDKCSAMHQLGYDALRDHHYIRRDDIFPQREFMIGDYERKFKEEMAPYAGSAMLAMVMQDMMKQEGFTYFKHVKQITTWFNKQT